MVCYLFEDFLLELLEELFLLLFLALFFFRGTFAPDLRASERPMAMACLRLVTFLPLRPLFSLPFFIARISRSTDFDAALLYLRPLDFFFVAIVHTSLKWEAADVARVVRDYLWCRYCRRQNILNVDPGCWIVAGITGDAEMIAFAAITGFL